MVERNFSFQEIPYSRLLQIPDDDNYLPLEDVNKPAKVNQLISPQYSYNSNYYPLTSVSEKTSPSVVSYQMSTEYSSNSNVSLEQMDNSYTNNRKRKASFKDIREAEESVEDDVKSTKTNDDNKKQNHSEIEKRRRDKMNTYITELSSMIPMCHAMSRKLDKLTVLRMAVQHIKSIRGTVHSYTEGHYKPSFLSDQELKHLILQVADGFLFVVGCDRGRILYVSKSVSKVLNYTQGDLLGQSWFDILHPKDVAKVKEQLSSSDLNPRERLIDAKTMLPVKTDIPQGVTRLCSGARRSFFCRMKYKISGQVKEEADTTTGCRRKKHTIDKKYNVIHCTGYLKSWTSAKIGITDQEGEGEDSCNLSCLVAIGRILPQITASSNFNISGKINVQPIQFVSRHSTDGKFLYVDQKATLILGFLPQELLGTSMYEYYHHDDIQILSECHKNALQTSERINTNMYRFRTKSNGFIQLQSEWKSFKNPWTKEIDYLIAKNTLKFADVGTVESSAGMSEKMPNPDYFGQTQNKEIHHIINSQVETSKIGCQIAEQILDSQIRESGSSLENSPIPESSLTVRNHLSLNFSPDDGSQNQLSQEYIKPVQFNKTRSNFSVSNISNDPGSSADDEIIEMMEDAVRDSPGNGPPTDGNDEAAMAVIMSLLEADAGLGGPVDFSGLPWPLP